MAPGPPARIHEYRNHHLDSTRWDEFVARDDDIVVTTAYKAGTTWTQRILAALIFGPGRLPKSLGEMSPWIDARFHGPIEPILAGVEAQEHRRFLKSHLAADGIRFFPEAKYIVVGRDTRDVFMSFFNHYSGYTDFMYDLFNDAERPGPEFPRCPDDPRAFGRVGSAKAGSSGSPTAGRCGRIIITSRRGGTREEPNVLFVHYGDLKADPEAEIRRIAGFCDIEIDEGAFPALLEGVGLDAMRAEARGTDDPMQMAFEGGAARFFFKGEPERWRGVLTEDDLELYEAAASKLDPDLRRWLEGGRHALAP